MRESNFNKHRFQWCRDDRARPYPTAEDVYVRSHQSHPDNDEFSDLGLSDFFIAHRWVSRKKLEKLQLTPFAVGLLSQGVQSSMDRQEPYNEVLEASIGYAGAIGVTCMDEIATVCERTNELSLKVEEANGRAVQALDRVRELEEENRGLMTIVEGLLTRARACGQLHSEWRTVTEGLTSEVGRLRDDLARLTHRVVNGGGPSNAAERQPQRLGPYQGQLVPIEETDRAEDRETVRVLNF